MKKQNYGLLSNQYCCRCKLENEYPFKKKYNFREFPTGDKCTCCTCKNQKKNIIEYYCDDDNRKIDDQTLNSFLGENQFIIFKYSY